MRVLMGDFGQIRSPFVTPAPVEGCNRNERHLGSWTAVFVTPFPSSGDMDFSRFEALSAPLATSFGSMEEIILDPTIAQEEASKMTPTTMSAVLGNWAVPCRAEVDFYVQFDLNKALEMAVDPKISNTIREYATEQIAPYLNTPFRNSVLVALSKNLIDASDIVRAGAIQALTLAWETPGVKLLVEKLLKEDPSPYVREVAEEVLTYSN